MGAHHQRQSHVFIVRLWRESGDSAWRGHIQHVSSQQQYYFTLLADMNIFIQSQLNSKSEKGDHST